MKLLLLPLLLIASPVSAAPWRRIEGMQGFAGMRAEIERKIARNPNIKGPVHVCLVVETDFKDGPVAWAHVPAAGWLYAFGETRSSNHGRR